MAIEFKNLTVGYPRPSKKTNKANKAQAHLNQATTTPAAYPGSVLQNVDGKLPPLVCLLGANGCGKTTLLRTLMGFIPPLHGSVWVNGLNVHSTPRALLAQHLAYVPQRGPEAHEHRVLDMVVMGTLHHWGGLHQGPQAQHYAQALAALEQLGLAKLAQANLGELSGGQQQLVALARALAQGANTLVLDEPTANLDPYNARKVAQVLHGLVHNSAQAHTVLMSTHQPELALQLQAHCLLLRHGRVQTQGSAHNVLGDDMLESLYG